MSALLDNNKDDIAFLQGATIEKIWLATWDDGIDVEPEGVIRMRVRYAPGQLVNNSTRGEFELWQDGEGNGPGFLSFVDDLNAPAAA